MKKRKISILALLIVAIMCFSVGIIGCSNNTEKRIVIQTESRELVVARGDGYTTPIAGVFDDNLDRINGMQVIARVYNAKGDLIDESEPSEQVTFSFVSTGTWTIEYEAYKGGVSESSIPKEIITVYVCSRLANPSNFNVDTSTNTLSWKEVPNASGYEVTINGDESFTIDQASFTNDIFSQEGFYVTVTAKGDNRNYVDSKMATYRNRTPLADGVLMAFDDPNYELDVKEAVSPKITLAPDEIEWFSEEQVPGSNGGALKVRIRSGNYGWGVFKIMIPEMTKLDSSADWSGMEIRYKVVSDSYRDDTWFFLNPPAKHNNAQRSGMHVKAEKNDQWQVLRLDKSVVIKEGYTLYDTVNCSTTSVDNNVATWQKDLNACGYQIEVIKADSQGNVIEEKTYDHLSSDKGFVAGDETSYSFDLKSYDIYEAGADYQYSIKVLCEIPAKYDSMNFNLYDLVRTVGKGYVYFDYVRLYKDELAAPENLRYEDGKILWDVADGVQKYTLNIIKTVDGVEKHSQYYVDGLVGEFDISNTGLTEEDKFSVEIMAIPTDATYRSSEYGKFSAINAPINLAIDENGLLTWSAVENADYYVVSVNGSEETCLNTSISLADYIRKGDVSVKVKAIANVGYLDSVYSKPLAKITVSGTKIASFDNDAYQEIVRLGLDNTVQPWIADDGKSTLTKEQYQNLPMAKQYLPAFTGTNSGVLFIQPVIARYSGSGSGRHAVFTIDLPTSLEGLDDGIYDGITIKFRLEDITLSGDGANKTVATPDSYYVNLVGASDLTTGYTGKVGVNPCITVKRGEWTTWTISASELAQLSYKDGTTEIAFAIVYEKGCSNIGYRINTYIDDISYYKQLSKPENVALNGNLLSWNTVKGANGYVVKIGDKEYSTTTNSFDASAHISTATCYSVKAIDSTKNYNDSEFTNYYVVVVSGKQIANFDSSGYVDYVKLGSENTVQPTNYGTLDAGSFASLNLAKEYLSDVEGSTNGALHIQPVFTRYKSSGMARHALFTVSLPSELHGLEDGSYDGITIRFMIGSITSGSGYAPATKNETHYYLNFVKSDAASSGYTERNEKGAVTDPNTVAEMNEWVTWKLTKAQLESLGYTDGATELCFVVYDPTGNQNRGHAVNVYLDYIEYYND